MRNAETHETRARILLALPSPLEVTGILQHAQQLRLRAERSVKADGCSTTCSEADKAQGSSQV